MRRIGQCSPAAALAIGLAVWLPSAAMAAPKTSAAKTKTATTTRLAEAKMGAMHGKMGAMHGGMMMQTADSTKLQKSVTSVKSKAAKKGQYACCINPSCEWCAVHMGKCMCAKGVMTGMGPCRECHGGWEAGQGDIPGKTKDNVRKQPTMKM